MAHVQAPIFFIHAANGSSLVLGKVLDALLQQLGEPHRLKIYPSIGQTPKRGTPFPFFGVRISEPDVFAFLDEHLRAHPELGQRHVFSS